MFCFWKKKKKAKNSLTIFIRKLTFGTKKSMGLKIKLWLIAIKSSSIIYNKMPVEYCSKHLKEWSTHKVQFFSMIVEFIKKSNSISFAKILKFPPRVLISSVILFYYHNLLVFAILRSHIAKKLDFTKCIY